MKMLTDEERDHYLTEACSGVVVTATMQWGVADGWSEIERPTQMCAHSDNQQGRVGVAKPWK